MKKIPTLYVRDRTTHLVTDEVTPGCEWVFTEKGVQGTRKWDGTCCRILGGLLYKRFEHRPGRKEPEDFEQEEYDENTGKTFGWIPVGDGPDDKWHREALADSTEWADGTYELCGPKVQGNPEGFSRHVLVPHGEVTVQIPEVTKPYRDVLLDFFRQFDIEGIVFYGADGKRAKIKGRDFGIKRGAK